ncbi:rubredoxin [Candidatus Bathyarchaeota archaeon]|jgi:pyruvate oxidase|nr:MAG: rubredoxin [Candidatus Bathyarchaeota archaeon]
MAKWRCTVCNYLYDEEKEGVRFADLPADWICPVCSAPKSAFVLEGAEAGVPESAPTVGDKIVEHLE